MDEEVKKKIDEVCKCPVVRMQLTCLADNLISNDEDKRKFIEFLEVFKQDRKKGVDVLIEKFDKEKLIKALDSCKIK